ncbi:MAG TPA: hypothetical protein VGK34_00600, partial [Armatimonadota bacterium]
MDDQTYASLEERLNSFAYDERTSALKQLAESIGSGKIEVPAIRHEVNIHYHTFFSFNTENWSPSRIAWECFKYGLEISGIVDFDVLDGMDEFIRAGRLLGIKAVVGMETRVFIRELADKVISSPNEPGVAYFMASGCCRLPEEGSESAEILRRMREMAKKRNLDLVERINAYLDDVKVDYDKDVIPLTPSGNCTERHLLLAYDKKARSVFADDSALANFWARKLGVTEEDASYLIGEIPKFHEKMRAKLMKFGGAGYVAPDSETFPSIEDAVKMIRGMGAIPTIAWLDGTSP